MLLRCRHVGELGKTAAFTLAEVLIATVFVALFVSCILNGYVQSNRMAEWSSMSLAAQSLASQGMEQARCAQWNSQAFPYATGPGTGDELPPTNYSLSGPDYALDVPATGTPFYATNFITVTNATVANGTPLRIIRSDCVWRFPPTGKLFTNSMVTYRAPDQ